MRITKANAKTITEDYYNTGNASHFLFNGSKINGFLFKRKELNDLIKDNSNKELFMALALSADTSNPPAKYLNVVIGSMLSSTLDTENLVISDETPHTGSISIFGASIIKSGAEVILPAELMSMHRNFKDHATLDHLSSTTGVKIKGYTLDKGDLVDLSLTDTVTSNNQNDLFIFMPVIRSGAAPFDRPYMSLAVARYNRLTMMVSGTIVEYCLPCPNACPNNYPIS